MVAVGQEDELGQEGRPLLLVVEVLQVGVADVVEDDLAPRALGQEVGQLALAGLEHAFDGDVLEGYIDGVLHVRSRKLTRLYPINRGKSTRYFWSGSSGTTIQAMT